LSGRTILVAEDNTVNRMLAEVHLRSLGCEVLLAGEGAEAVRMWQQNRHIDAVLMDCLMPVMDGYAATRAIRAAESPGHRIPIVALTANVMEVDHQACFEAGMDDVLTKPYTRDQLREQLLTTIVRR
jgi:CheY-like chemotaxis protein